MEIKHSDMKERNPTLCVVAGPNGSGKTTTTVQLLNNEWTTDSLYINPDIIAQEIFGDWNSRESILKAAEYATQLRYECLEKGHDFVFETVFSSSEKLEFLHKAKDAGFFIRFFYVCTSDPTINIARIAQRYLNGGHEVPISKVISRYYKPSPLLTVHISMTIPLTTTCHTYSIAHVMARYINIIQMISQSGLRR